MRAVWGKRRSLKLKVQGSDLGEARTWSSHIPCDLERKTPSLPYIYIYIYLHVYMYTHVYIYKHTYIFIYIYI